VKTPRELEEAMAQEVYELTPDQARELYENVDRIDKQLRTEPKTALGVQSFDTQKYNKMLRYLAAEIKKAGN
jgi:Leu/Phe-tRNA-protein transferase